MTGFDVTSKATGDPARLDRLLNAWAERSALPADRAEAIRRGALRGAVESPGQTYAWWKRIFTGQPSETTSSPRTTAFWRRLPSGLPPFDRPRIAPSAL